MSLGQASYERRMAAWRRRVGNRGRAISWSDLTEEMRADEEAGAQVVAAGGDRLRAGVRALLARVARSADATRPSVKTSVEDEIAAQLRQLLEL